MSISTTESSDGQANELLNINERVQLMRDGVWNSASLLVSGSVGILLVPIMLQGLGAELYGLWVAALSVAGLVALIDFGLGWIVIREIAARHDRTGDEVARFVSTAGNLSLLVGGIGAVVVAAVGLAVSGGLHLSPPSRTIAATAFVLAGGSLFADRIFIFAMNVLRGLQRFETVNRFTIPAALLRALGITIIIRVGAGLLPVMVWQIMTTTGVALLGLSAITRFAPELRLRLGEFDWPLIRTHLPFCLWSQFSDAAGRSIWDTAPLVVGLILGSAWIADFTVAQKFPWAVTAVLWSAAGPLFPAAASDQPNGNLVRAGEVLEMGTRWMVVLAIPLCAVLWITTPALLQAWVGAVSPDTVATMRLITLGALADAILVAPIQSLWAWGVTRVVFTINAALAITTLLLSLLLLPRIGIMGAGWAVLIPTALGAIVGLHCGCRACGSRVSALLRKTFQGLMIPGLLCIAVTIATLSIPVTLRGAKVALAAVAGGCAYAAALYLGGSRPDERRLLREGMRFPAAVGALLYRKCRGCLSLPSSMDGL